MKCQNVLLRGQNRKNYIIMLFFELRTFFLVKIVSFLFVKIYGIFQHIFLQYTCLALPPFAESHCFFWGQSKNFFFFTEVIYEGTCDLHLWFCQKGKLASLVAHNGMIMVCN